MRTPTPDQQAVLESGARIKLVRAAPGSGKTWMVAEAIRLELQKWKSSTGGVAALSFTRVGGQEISNALGRSMSHPHFVGTLDAFLFRYVVKPHLRAIDPRAKIPELIPADWEPERIWTSATLPKGINPYACVWIARDEQNQPVLAQINKYGGAVKVLIGDDRKAVVNFKKQQRRRTGRISISDSALWASTILSHDQIGKTVCDEMTRRFPLIVVDELQDTGVFLGESIRALLSTTKCRGLLVGDPDQSIYEFNGAVPGMFDSFATMEGVEPLELRSSRRCPPDIVAAASLIKKSNYTLGPANDRIGSAFLIQYKDMMRDVATIATRFNELKTNGETIKVITRSNSTVYELLGRKGGEVANLSCRPAALMQRAVQQFRRGKPNAALAAAMAAMELMILDGEGFADEDLLKRQIPPAELKAASIRCLLRGNSISTDYTVRDWQINALTLLETDATIFCSRLDLTLPRIRKKPNQSKGHDKPISDSIPVQVNGSSKLREIPIVTVHGVKGETHDATILVVPPNKGKSLLSKCPSNVWWSELEVDQEERRVAYVALTRTRQHLAVCVDQKAFARLSALRPDFVNAFRCLTVQEFVDTTDLKFIDFIA